MKLPVIKPREVIKALKKKGFEEDRQSGSHLILRDPVTRKIVVVPIHPKDIKKGTLKSIIRQAHLTLEQFLELLD